MPNWCSCKLTIRGSSQAIERLIDANLSLGKLVPEPMPADENPDWYDWRVQNWGTKWDINLESGGYDSDPEEGWLDANYEAPWEPHIAGLANIVEQFKKAGDPINLEIAYISTESRYVGRALTRNGKLIDERKSYDSADELEEASNKLGLYMFEDTLAGELEYLRDEEEEDEEDE